MISVTVFILSIIGSVYGDTCYYTDGRVLDCYSCCEYDCCSYGYVGGIGAGVFGVCVLVAIICCCVRRHRAPGVIVTRAAPGPAVTVVQTNTSVNPFHAGYNQPPPPPPQAVQPQNPPAYAM